jgi:hypothetical protein
VAASGAWTSPDDFVGTIVRYHTPISTSFRLHVAGDLCEVYMEDNVGLSGPPPVVHLTGRAKS